MCIRDSVRFLLRQVHPRNRAAFLEDKATVARFRAAISELSQARTEAAAAVKAAKEAAAEAAKAKPEDMAWSELVAVLGLQTDESSELKRTKTALEETKKMLENKDEEHKSVLEKKEEESESLRKENQQKDEQHKTEIAKKDEEMLAKEEENQKKEEEIQEMREELARLRAQDLVTVPEGVPEV